MCGDMGKAVLRALTGALLCGLVSDAAYLQTPWPDGYEQTVHGNRWPGTTHDHVIVMDENTPAIEWILGRLDKPSIHHFNRWPPKRPLDKPNQDYFTDFKTEQTLEWWKPKDYKPWDKWKEDFDYRPSWRPFEYKYIPKDSWRPNLDYRHLDTWKEHHQSWKDLDYRHLDTLKGHHQSWWDQENYQSFEFKPHTKWRKKVNPKLPLPKPFRYYSDPQRQKYWWNRYHEPDYPHYEQAIIQKPLREHEKPQDLRNVPGSPGVDYPIYHSVPETGFSCNHVPVHPGMYANVETGCQAYHVCHDGREGHQGASFLCTNGTLFDQEKFACDWWYNVDCSQAIEHYKLNADPLKNPYTPKPKPEEQLEQQGIYYKL